MVFSNNALPTPTAANGDSLIFEASYQTLADEYEAENPKSRALHDAATSSLPGGNTRTVLYYHPFPLSIVSASHSTLVSAEGHNYTDLLGEYTAGLYGHSQPAIVEAITSALHNGINFGSHHANEARLARLIKERFESIDLVRFTNSGTEATLMALAAAKVYARKPNGKVLVFEGGYHGGVFSFGHGVAAANCSAPNDYVLAQYNDISSVEALVSANTGEIAVIIVEPMVGSGGAIPGTKEFLQFLRAKATEVDAVLIFDEVMTSRLYTGGGVQTHLGIKPDLTTLGKYIGGGMSFGAFGGRKEIMELFDPRSKSALAHAGTFNNNVLTMAAGSVGLETVFTRQVAEELHERGERLRERLNAVGKGTLMKVTGCGSIMCFHFITTPLDAVRAPNDMKDKTSQLGVDLGDLLHLFLLKKRFYIARRGFVALSLALTSDDLEGFVAAVSEFVENYRKWIGC